MKDGSKLPGVLAAKGNSPYDSPKKNMVTKRLTNKKGKTLTRVLTTRLTIKDLGFIFCPV